ncbi:hypothetical protein B9Z65_521 [Elsinoe australis]|uniref:Uncharacterized protein n=1 Tax=Elsinoe australis TaxID=40998 RepID=A0A2P8AIU4_9PEZI|nr:hypothetical protein B9Z65_521 [Elsinoe australis]
MSSGKLFGYVLVGTCSVATAYYTFAPELQRLQQEKQATFRAQHPSAPPIEQTQAAPAASTAIETTPFQSDSMPKPSKEPIKEEVQKAWPGLSWLKWSYGGAGTTNEQKKKE